MHRGSGQPPGRTRVGARTDAPPDGPSPSIGASHNVGNAHAGAAPVDDRQTRAGFLDSIDDVRAYEEGGLFGLMGHRGDAPAPFDALDGPRLAAPGRSHPLPLVDPLELIRSSTDGLDGVIEVESPIRVGEAIRGRARIVARKPIDARRAGIRLVSVLLSEEERSLEHRDSKGQVISRDEWVEVHGRTVDALEFTEPHVPARLGAGQVLDLPFQIPAPRLGPPSAHAGTALVAWAVEARWDIEMGADERVAALVDVRQHPDLLRAGVIHVGAGAMHDSWDDGGATLGVRPLPPVDAGTTVEATITWPGAASGRSARVELVADVEAARDMRVVCSSVEVAIEAIREGVRASLAIPANAPPTCETDGLRVSYRLRAIVDRAWRPDEVAERPIVIC